MVHFKCVFLAVSTNQMIQIEKSFTNPQFFSNIGISTPRGPGIRKKNVTPEVFVLVFNISTHILVIILMLVDFSWLDRQNALKLPKFD